MEVGTTKSEGAVEDQNQASHFPLLELVNMKLGISGSIKIRFQG